MKATDAEIRLEIPVGWTHETFGSDDRWVTIREPTHGCMVTVDFEQRKFFGGMTRADRPLSIKTYAGRGWRAMLVADAVTWLSGISEGRS